MEKTVVKNSNSILKCFNCLENYKEPILLNCFHFCCRNCCIDLIQNQKEIKCQNLLYPFDDLNNGEKCLRITLFTVEQLNKAMKNDWLFLLFLFKFNHNLQINSNQNETNELKKEEEKEEIKCSNEDGNKAISKCLDCNDFLCEKCFDVHKIQKLSKNHKYEQIKLKIKQENILINSSLIIPKCESHKKEYEYYCIDLVQLLYYFHHQI